MKIILKFILLIFLSFIFFILYLSLIGIETSRFNKQIEEKIKGYNQKIDVDLKDITILLDPLRLKINVKTTGSKLINKDKIIEIENLKAQLPISSIINNKFLIQNLDISTKTLEIKNLISFIRIFKNKPEIYLLEKIINKGFIIADIKLNFDDKGNIQDDLKINGFIKDLKIDLIDRYKIDEGNFIFQYNLNNLNFNDISFKLNSLKFSSDRLSLKKNKNTYKISGEIKNDLFDLNKNNINLLIRPYFPKFEIEKIKFKSKSSFNFQINEKYKISNFTFSSDINLDELLIFNKLELKEIFPDIKKKISFLKNKILVNYNDDDFNIEGNGKILFQNKEDKFNFLIKKNNKSYKFKSSIEIENNPFQIKILDYEKNPDKKLIINIDGIRDIKNKTLLKLISIKERDNIFQLNNLLIDNQFKLIDFKDIHLDYLDKSNNKNRIKIKKKKNIYTLNGDLFNADKIISYLMKDTETNNQKKFFNKNFELKIKIDNLLLDKDHSLVDFKGNLNFENQEIIRGQLTGFFSDEKKLNLTVKTVNNEKITTLFVDNAKPIVKRYSFIKGFDEGILDFYSSKKEDISNSKLKIYDFKLRDLPALTKLLTLASLQGIADILSGEGIRFDEFEMSFNKRGNLMTIDEIYAIGPAISILMNGYIEKKKVISLRGTLVPATTINKVIGSIPILGQILVGSKTGEGVFGVSFKIKGPPDNLETTVNPIKTLTPRFITRTIEKIKKN